MNLNKNTRIIAFLMILVFFLTCQILAGDKKKKGNTSKEKSEEKTIRTLEFSSGGSRHPSGHGEWIIKLESDGKMTVSHRVGSRQKNYDPFKLTEEENEKIWKIIDSVNVKKLESSTRDGVPDEVKYTFTLINGDNKYKKSIWINDARKNKVIVDLVESFTRLIEKYIERKPVMK